MTERLVSLYVTLQTKKQIKKLKGDLTYEQYIQKIMESKN